MKQEIQFKQKYYLRHYFLHKLNENKQTTKRNNLDNNLSVREMSSHIFLKIVCNNQYYVKDFDSF